MNVPPEEVDPAAVFAIATSLQRACEERLKHDPRLNLAEAYNGWDQFTRELMRVAGMFEEWACMHVAFDHMEDTWSYYLDIYFGIYGIDEDGFLEHIADRPSYPLAREFVLRLVPQADCAEKAVGLCPRC